MWLPLPSMLLCWVTAPSWKCGKGTKIELSSRGKPVYSSRNSPWICYYNSDKKGCTLNWRRSGSTWRVKWASCGCVFLAVSRSNLSRYYRTQSQFMSFHVCLEISRRYCSLNVFFFILQRRRRIDRSMIGEPMNFKVSALFWCLILFSRVKFNKLFDWLELSYFDLNLQHTGHIGSGDMASGSDVSRLFCRIFKAYLPFDTRWVFYLQEHLTTKY